MRSKRSQVRSVSPWPQFSHYLSSIHTYKQLENLETTVQELRDQLSAFQLTASQEKDSLIETINSLRSQEEHASTSIATTTSASLTSASTRKQTRTSRANQPGTARPTCRIPTCGR